MVKVIRFSDFKWDKSDQHFGCDKDNLYFSITSVLIYEKIKINFGNALTKKNLKKILFSYTSFMCHFYEILTMLWPKKSIKFLFPYTSFMCHFLWKLLFVCVEIKNVPFECLLSLSYLVIFFKMCSSHFFKCVIENVQDFWTCNIFHTFVCNRWRSSYCFCFPLSVFLFSLKTFLKMITWPTPLVAPYGLWTVMILFLILAGSKRLPSWLVPFSIFHVRLLMGRAQVFLTFSFFWNKNIR